jgi:hypothetical protein
MITPIACNRSTISHKCRTESAKRSIFARRLTFSNFDRLIFANLYRIVPGVLNPLMIVKPENVFHGLAAMRQSDEVYGKDRTGLRQCMMHLLPRLRQVAG